MDHEDLSDDDSSDCDQPYYKDDDSYFDLSTIFSKLMKKGRKCEGESAGNDDTDDPIVDKLQNWMTAILKSVIPTPKQVAKLNTLDAKAKRTNRLITTHNEHGYKVMGKFSDDELTLLRNRWSTFCAEHGFDEMKDLRLFVPNPFCPPQMKLTVPQREWFLQHLSQDFPDRDPQQVYHKFVAVFLTPKRGRWSPEEDEFLLTFYNLMPDMAIYSIGAFILRRKRPFINRRLTLLTGCSAPVQHMLKLKKAKISEVESADPNVPEYPDWTKKDKKWKIIAARSNMNRRLLMRKYYFELYPAIRAAGFQTIRMEEKEVLRCLTKEKPSSWDSVDWFKIGRKCNNIGAVKAYQTIRQMAIRRVPAPQWEDLPAVLARLNHSKPSRMDKSKADITDDEIDSLGDDNMSDSE
ncbi:Hypothetical protein NTJ_00357 [Nesidiocoris tenuis]|uniref:Uncharacterized protein n=1 Tax=Nesidiocoris tenuis TaxID=355587 RepID=A0ABN7A5R1_9HEMI|nr:Hypothetical protein NTJ_00357 [Nesidiocoris tenuis]